MLKNKIFNLSAVIVPFFLFALLMMPGMSSCTKEESVRTAGQAWEAFDFFAKENIKMIGDEFNIDVSLVEGRRDAWYSLNMVVDGENGKDPDCEGRIFMESEHLSVSCGQLGNGFHVIDLSIKDKMDSTVVHRISFNVLGKAVR